MPGGSRLRVLELYCGIGGVSAALGEAAEVVAAVDIHRQALEVYGLNFKSPRIAALVESLSSQRLESFDADLWWASPPCQPFTRRGHQRALEDPRAATFLALLDAIESVRPHYFALENVIGFDSSPARDVLVERLTRSGYGQILEQTLCPSRLGMPNQRPRFYLVASLEGSLVPPPTANLVKQPLAALLDIADSAAVNPPALDDLRLDPEIFERYRHAIHVVHAEDEHALTRCFTSAYGRSPVRSGSYLADQSGVRLFSALEILRLLGFPPSFKLPSVFSEGNRRGIKKAWRLAGNSVSLPAVRHVLSAIPELSGILEH